LCWFYNILYNIRDDTYDMNYFMYNLKPPRKGFSGHKINRPAVKMLNKKSKSFKNKISCKNHYPWTLFNVLYIYTHVMLQEIHKCCTVMRYHIFTLNENPILWSNCFTQTHNLLLYLRHIRPVRNNVHVLI
jgi:hypothetical protein